MTMRQTDLFNDFDDLLREAMQSRPEPGAGADLAALAMGKVAAREAFAAARIGVIERYRRYTRYATAAAAVLIGIIVGAVVYQNRASFVSAVGEGTTSSAVEGVSETSGVTGSESFSWSQVLLAATATLTVAAVAFGLSRALADDRPRPYPMSA